MKTAPGIPRVFLRVGNIKKSEYCNCIKIILYRTLKKIELLKIKVSG